MDRKRALRIAGEVADLLVSRNVATVEDCYDVLAIVRTLSRHQGLCRGGFAFVQEFDDTLERASATVDEAKRDAWRSAIQSATPDILELGRRVDRLTTFLQERARVATLSDDQLESYIRRLVRDIRGETKKHG